LWTFDGELKVYDWNDLVESLVSQENDRSVFSFCFLNGSSLYEPVLVQLFSDEEFRQLLMQKIKRLEEYNLQFELDQMDKFLIGCQDVPAGVLPTDTEIYSNKLYFATDEGFYSCDVHKPKSRKYPVGKNADKLWDCNLLSIRANKYPQLALSGGNEGLFEYNIAPESFDDTKLNVVEDHCDGGKIYQISDRHSTYANYVFSSIYNTSYVSNSFLATFAWNKAEQKKRNFENIVDGNKIFQDKEKTNYISWGIQDKIYRAKKNGFEIIKYNPFIEDGEYGDGQFTRLHDIDLQAWKGEVISGGTAYFGNIVECENALIVITSDNKTITIPGPITQWRVYPRSFNYENHLHVILDDKIEIYSFNQDYFVNQNDKSIGIKYSDTKRKQYNKPQKTR
jgi:hypothetical protein